jgi:predicted cupin superfamily sugar epimerase
MDRSPHVEALIRALDLRPLPMEGGLYRETYAASGRLPGAAGRAGKPYSTAIYYLLTSEPDAFSALHRLTADEVWHFYLGDPLEMTLLFPDGTSRQVILGPDVLGGQQVQFVVPRGVWQGTRLLPGGTFALVGNTVAPGFTADDYQPGDRAELIARYPQEAERITALTRV